MYVVTIKVLHSTTWRTSQTITIKETNKQKTSWNTIKHDTTHEKKNTKHYNNLFRSLSKLRTPRKPATSPRPWPEQSRCPQWRWSADSHWTVTISRVFFRVLEGLRRCLAMWLWCILWCVAVFLRCFDGAFMVLELARRCFWRLLLAVHHYISAAQLLWSSAIKPRSYGTDFFAELPPVGFGNRRRYRVILAPLLLGSREDREVTTFWSEFFHRDGLDKRFSIETNWESSSLPCCWNQQKSCLVQSSDPWASHKNT